MLDKDRGLDSLVQMSFQAQSVDNLLSFGDMVPPGDFHSVWSRHARVVNFAFQERVLSVGDGSICPGPFRICLKDIGIASIERVLVSENEITVNDRIKIPVDPARRFDSGVDLSFLIPKIIWENIPILRDLVDENSAPESLAWLMRDCASAPGGSPFNVVVNTNLCFAFEHLCSGDIQSAVNGFRGCGIGLTPSGDDFLIGLLLGLGVREISEKKDLHKIRSLIYKESLAKNLLVNTLLHQSMQMRPDENWRRLIYAIGGAGELEAAGMDVIKHGASSGADTLTGFISAWYINT